MKRVKQSNSLKSFALIFIFPCIANAEGLLDYSSTNIQALYGSNYELGPEERTIFTLEHASGFEYGDNYAFIDYTKDSNSYYMEWTPRLSLSKISGNDIGFGPIKDIFLIAVYELPSDIPIRDGYGVGLDWHLPTFQYFKTNIFQRDDPRHAGDATLLTIAWGADYKINTVPLRLEGYCDFQGAEGESDSYINCVPRFLVDIGSFSGRSGTLFAGVEWQYWNKKFGVDGVRESVIQAQIKLIL